MKSAPNGMLDPLIPLPTVRSMKGRYVGSVVCCGFRCPLSSVGASDGRCSRDIRASLFAFRRAVAGRLTTTSIPAFRFDCSSLTTLLQGDPVLRSLRTKHTYMAETDTHSTTPPIELGTPWKSASQNGKTVERLPLSPEQTHAAVTRQHDSRASATRQRDSEERSTSDHKRSSGGSRQQEAVERDGSVGVERNGGASATTSGDEMTSRRLLSPHNDERVRAAHTTPSPAPQQPPFPPRPSSSLGPAATPATVVAQRRNLAAVSAISCSMCSATGVNSLWRRDRAGKPICGKCCEQLRRRLNPRYVSSNSSSFRSRLSHFSLLILPLSPGI